MRIRCLLGHEWRQVPWFKPMDLDHRWRQPEKMCMRCFKEWRKSYSFIITSIEGPGIGYYMAPYYEGQTPPKGWDSWGAYNKHCREEMLKTLRKERRFQSQCSNVKKTAMSIISYRDESIT